jgi:hypothetical protein
VWAGLHVCTNRMGAGQDGSRPSSATAGGWVRYPVWLLPTLGSASRLQPLAFARTLPGEALSESGKAENALIIFCNFWKVPAVSNLQTSPEMKIQNKVGSKWAS